MDGKTLWDIREMTRDELPGFLEDAIMLMLYWGLTTWISTFLVREHCLNIKTMGLVAAVPFVTAFVAMYGGGWAADKFFLGRPKVVTMAGFPGCIPGQAGRTGQAEDA